MRPGGPASVANDGAGALTTRKPRLVAGMWKGERPGERRPADARRAADWTSRLGAGRGARRIEIRDDAEAAVIAVRILRRTSQIWLRRVGNPARVKQAANPEARSSGDPRRRSDETGAPSIKARRTPPTHARWAADIARGWRKARSLIMGSETRSPREATFRQSWTATPDPESRERFAPPRRERMSLTGRRGVLTSTIAVQRYARGACGTCRESHRRRRPAGPCLGAG